MTLLNKLMKPYKSILLLFIIIVLHQSCERDDICTDDTTPRLLIEFFDITEQDVLKNVPRLSVYDVNADPNDVNTNFIVNNSNVNAIALPLRFENEGELTTTEYILELDSNLRLDDDPNTTSNMDTIRITYTPEFQFVSRACGFKSLFNNISIEVLTDDDNWILLTNFSNNLTELNVEDETTTHINIFH